MTRLNPYPSLSMPTLAPLSLAGRARRRAPTGPPLDPEEERSLLQSGVGLLQSLGRAFDKPGSAARGVIHGLTDLAQGDRIPEWGGGLLNALPFSDTFGLTNPEDTVSGRDVLENVGVLPKNKPGFFNSFGDAAGDVAGLATEVVADPLFWMTGPLGSVTKAGKAAEAAAKGAKRAAGSKSFGELAEQTVKRLEPTAAGEVAPLGQIESPASLIEGLEQGTRSLFGLTKNPLKRGADVTLADLPAGRSIDQAAAKALKAIHYGLGDPITKALSAPIRQTRRLFDVSAQGLVRTVEQFLGDKSFRTYRRLEGVMDDFAPAAFARESELVEQFKDIASNAKTPGDEASYNNMARYLFEMPYFKTVKDVKDHVDFQFGAAATPEAIAARDKFSESFFEYMDNMFTVKNKLYDEAGRLGIDVSKLEDTDPFVAHLRRRTAGIDSDLIGRNKLYVRVPGGTKTMNDMATEPLLTAPTMRDMAAVSETAGKATDLEVGAYVRAADRANEGRITSIDEASGTANVYFHNKKTGTTKTVPLKLNKLTRVQKDGAPVFKPISQKQLAAELQDRLRNHINPVTGQPEPLSDLGKIEEMQERLIWDGIARPELDKWHAFRLAQTTDPDEIVKLNAQYDQVVDEWTKGYEILDEKGRPIPMDPKAKQFREYFDKQPAEIRLSGMYPRQVLEDQTEYIKTTMSYVATMREVHNLMREKGVLTTSEEGAVPLAKAWKDAGYKPEGLKTFAEENKDILEGLTGTGQASRPGAVTVQPEALGTRPDVSIGMDDLQRRFDEVYGDLGDKAAVDASLEKALEKGVPKEAMPDFAQLGEEALAMGEASPVASLYINEKAADALKAYKRVMTPKNDKVFLELIDPVVNMYRFGLTVPFPSFHVRNRFSGVMQSMMETPEVSLRALSNGSDETWKHMLGKKELPGDFLDFVTTADLMKGNMGKEFGAKAVTGIPGQGLIEGLMAPWRGITKKNWRSKFNPMNTPGFRPPDELGEAVSQNVLSEMAGNAMNFVETLNRVGYAKALWDKGYSPSDIINHVRRSQFDYCVDEETEILTNHGWKKYYEIRDGDLALTLDPETRNIDWGLIQDVNVFPSPGELTHIKTNRFDAMVTDNHRWLAAGCGILGSHHSLRHSKQHFATTTEVLKYRRKLIVAGGNPIQSENSLQVFADEFVDLVGWYITEGSDCQTKYGVIVSQSQKHNPTHVRTIRKLQTFFSDCGATTTEYAPRDCGHGPVVQFYFGKGIGEIIRSVCPDKQMTPEFLLSLTTPQKKRLLKTLIDGDGHRKDGTEIWAQKDVRRCNSFQMLAAMLGVRSNMREIENGCHTITLYRTELLFTDNFKKKPWQVSRVPYNGVIWCPTTPTGTWMARRGGTTYWTGNSELTQFEQNVMRRVVPFFTWSKKNLPYQLKKLAEQPGGATAQAIRGLTSRDEDQTYIPSFLRERNAFLAPQGLPDWLGGEKGPSDTTFVTQTGVPIEDFNKFISEPGSGLLNRRSAQRLSAELHPLLGAGLRQYSGVDPFTGRPLKHLRSTTDEILNPMGIPSLPEGTKQYVDRIIQASPFSRLAGTMATAVDPRKSYPERLLNLASGARFSTYDTEVERARDLEKAQEKVLGTRPEVWEFNSFFVPESFQGPQAEQSRQDVQTLRQLEKVRKMLQEKNQAQKNSR